MAARARRGRRGGYDLPADAVIPMRHRNRASYRPRIVDVRSKHRVRAAYVRVERQTVIVVEIKASRVADAFEAQLALSAIELTCGHPAVLWATEPCGCRELFGRREHIDAINEMPVDRFDWKDVEIDFAHPVIPVSKLHN